MFSRKKKPTDPKADKDKSGALSSGSRVNGSGPAITGSSSNATGSSAKKKPVASSSSNRPPSNPDLDAPPPQPSASSNNIGATSIPVPAIATTTTAIDESLNKSSASSAADKKKTKHSISYAAERVIGNGSFGVVYQATVIETGETVAIKKVLQDRRFKNRELQIMRMLDHPTVVALKHSFLARGDKDQQPDDVYLNLVMEFIPETIHRTLRNHTKAKKLVPLVYTKVYMFQVCRALAYIHSLGICHRDIKPQNLLLDPQAHVVKLCDFGSAKILIKGQPNVAYICSRYYRAPELVFEATEYTTAIDIWSLGCVMAELLLGKPMFPGESGVDQLIEIIKVLGTPTREQIYAMNPNHTSFSFPQITPHPWQKVFRNRAPKEAIDLVSKFLVYKPKDRIDPFDAMLHPFFDELRDPNIALPNGKALPVTVFNFTDSELQMAKARGVLDQLIPPHLRGQFVDRIAALESKSN